MDNLENSSRKKTRRRELQHAVLNTIKVAGLLSIGLLAPNVLGALKKLGIIPKSRQREYIASSASKLTKRGLLKFENGRYLLTSSGEHLLRRWELEDYKIKSPKKWDKKWRVIIFDIPEKKAKIRRQVAYIFKQSGFYRLQDSVWVYPYDCEDIVGLLKTDFGVGRDVLYMIVDELENDKHLRKVFNLS
ncbi:MAG: CRISPR-associated endonuclease Cas2 [Patescibacteria group bacterium]